MDCSTPAFLSFTIPRTLFRFMSVELPVPHNHLILFNPLLCLPSVFPQIRVFSNELALYIGWPKHRHFSLSISPSNEYSGLTGYLELTGSISLQFKGLSRVFSNTTVQKHQFFSTWSSFMVQLSHPYMTTGKTIALTIQTFVGKVMSLIFNMLSGFVIAFLPRSKHLIILWLQSPSGVILDPPKNKICHCLYFFPIYLPWSVETRCHDLSFQKVKC